VGLRFDDVDSGACGAVLALAFPDRLAIRRSQPGQFQLRTGGSAWVAVTDPLARETFVVAADLDGNRTSARIRLAAGLDADDVLTSLADQIERRETLIWDKQRNDLVLKVDERLGSMSISESTRTPVAGSDTVDALIERIRATRLGQLDMSTAAGLRARVAFLHALDPDGSWPDWSDRRLLATLDDWLAPFLGRATGAGDLTRVDVAMILTSQLSWDDQVELGTAAPTSFSTPSDRTVVIDYTRDVPTASVRVQDLFGMRDHPVIANGRVALTLELLSPAGRPVQITRDLPGFWHGTWTEVRKDMVGRYPKHHWPVDPSTAEPKRMKPGN
jgi:ATP-dependent helicase HrpB